MGDDSSNDTSIVAITSDDEFDDKPIKKLFKRLINNDSKQNTILTNNQILDLLKVEFDINIYKLHNLEIDIYITLLKKFLKEWPLWDEFDRTVNEAKKKNDLPSIEGMLQTKYDHLKSHLQSVIDIAAPLAKDAINKIKHNVKKENTKTEVRGTVDNVLMEINASRSQLNSLFLRYPSAYSVFNVNEQKSTIIVPGVRKMESILNWWDINIEISRKNKSNTSTVLYQREMIHKFKHILVNKISPHKPELVKLNRELLVSNCEKSKLIEKETLIKYVDNIAKAYPIQNSVNEILKFIKMDLFLLPQTLFTMASYKKNMNEYGYVRYLYKEEENTKSDKYDLQLEESVTPMYRLFIGDVSQNPILEVDSIKVECSSCNVTFTGRNLVAELREHFVDHYLEPNWMCSHCHISFPMLHLASRWWAHRCFMDDETQLVERNNDK